MAAEPPADPFEPLLAEARSRTMAGLRAVLLTARPAILQKVAVGIVPALFHNDYRGEAGTTGDCWADAFARPAMRALPSFLVRVHAGTFSRADADSLVAVMRVSEISQAAVAVIGEPVPAEIRDRLVALVPWFIDADGLAHLMMSANVGVSAKVYETKYVDPAYFR
jgi:hypothetical protein